MRNKKEITGKFTYKSLFTGEYVMPHQWVAEILVQRKADRDKFVLSDRFWLENNEYSKEFSKQVQQAAKLIKKYSEEAVLNFIKNNPWKFSLFTKENIENIQKEQYIIETRIINEVEVQDAFEFVNRKQAKKSLLGKLNGKKKSSEDGGILVSANRKSLEKDFGNIFVDPQSIIDKKRTIFPLSPKLDIALSGGIPSGCWGIMSGLSGVGKSSAALQVCAKAQQIEYGSRKCYYFDVEHRLEKKNLSGIPGLSFDKDKLEIISSTKGNILTAEKVLTVAERLLKDEPGIIVVIDSSSSLCTSKEYDGDISAVGRNEGPRLLAQFTRKLNSVVSVQDSVVIIIQHLIANTSGYGSPWLEDGGNKIVYQSDFKLRGVSFKKWEQGEKQIGQVNNWHVIKSPLGQPGAKVESYLRYGSGIDYTWELIELACDVGLIMKGGAWFSLDFLDTPEKLQGQQGVWDYLNNDQDKLQLLEKKVKEFYVS